MTIRLIALLLAAAFVAAVPAHAAEPVDPAWPDVLSRIHAQHPLLQAAAEAAGAAQARLDNAGRRANPELEVEWENLAGTGDFGGTGASELTVLLSQELALGGKLDHRRQAAYAHTEVTPSARPCWPTWSSRPAPRSPACGPPSSAPG